MALLGNPFIANAPKQMTNKELAQAIRVDIAGELEAIIGYEAHAMATNDENVKKVLYHIADEERMYEELLLPDEGVEKTLHNKIFVSKTADPGENLEFEFARLRKVIKSGNFDYIRSILTNLTGYAEVKNISTYI